MDHSPLVSLADELILSILGQFDSRSDLCAFARTCRRFCNIAEPLIYGRIFIRTGFQANKIVDALDKNRQRAAAIISFEARCKYKKFLQASLCSEVIRLATNLREYVLESPFCNHQRWRSGYCRDIWPDTFDNIMSVFESATSRGSGVSSETITLPLQNLTKLVLHLNGVDGEEFWTCRPQDCCIFVLPSLLDLTISSAVFDINTQDVLHAPQSTSLRKLAFEECRFSNGALTGILSLPKALCSLYLGETRWAEDYPPDWKALVRNPMTFCAALSHQKHSLEYLKYTVGQDGLLEASEPTDRSFCGFADFSALRTVVLDPNCLMLERILHDLFTAPPSLQHLTIYRHLDAPPMASAWRIQTLDVIRCLEFARIPHAATSTWGRDLILAETTALARGAQQQKTHLRVWKEITSQKFVPPLLYGERPTRAQMIYDSSVHKDPNEVFCGQSWWINNTLVTDQETADDDTDDEDDSDDILDDFDTDEDSDDTDDDDFDDDDEDEDTDTDKEDESDDGNYDMDDGFEDEDDMDLE